MKAMLIYQRKPDLSFSYTGARRIMTINWNTDPENGNLRPRGTENILKNVLGPRSAAKYVQMPIESFRLFFTDEMVNSIVGYTNDVIQPVLEKFSDALEASTKYTHFHLVDHMDIRTFLGILYLRAALRLNLMGTSTIWHHENSKRNCRTVASSSSVASSLSMTKHPEQNAGRLITLLVWENCLS